MQLQATKEDRALAIHPGFEGAEQRSVVTRDGVHLHYEVVGREGVNAPTILLANGLGARLYAFAPLVERLGQTHKLISWDYRGLFRSGTPETRKSLAIFRHAEDACRILDAEAIQQASVVGWSMGVQVALEMAGEWGDRVDRLILLNGTHGHALETALQPLLRIPYVPRLLERVLEAAIASPRLSDLTKVIARSDVNVRGLGGLLARLRKNPRLTKVYRQYVDDVFGESYPNYLRLFQELNAHSVYHVLPEIAHPTLVISGGLDPLTPAYQSFEIARRMPNATHIHVPWASHFVILECEERVCSAISRFLGVL